MSCKFEDLGGTESYPTESLVTKSWLNEKYSLMIVVSETARLQQLDGVLTKLVTSLWRGIVMAVGGVVSIAGFAAVAVFSFQSPRCVVLGHIPWLAMCKSTILTLLLESSLNTPRTF